MVGLPGADQQGVAAELFDEEDQIIYGNHLTIKDRKKVLSDNRNEGEEVVACVVAEPFDRCLAECRETAGGEAEEELRRQRGRFQIPFPEEGFDRIILFHTQEPDLTLEEMTSMMKGFDQHTSHHMEKYLDIHLGNVVKLFQPEDRAMEEACLLHDFGKLYTQKFGDDGEAHYYNHANVGAYEVMTRYRNSWDDETFRKILFLINYHMEPFQWQKGAALQRKRVLYGEENFDLLMKFNQADIGACRVLKS